MADRHIVIATNSRFRGLEDYLLQNRIPGSRTTIVKVIPGGTLLSCYYALKSSFYGILGSRLQELPFSFTIAAGICDFTTKMKNGQASELAYPQSKLDQVIADIDFISAMAIAELKNPVRFCTIPPSDMFRYREHQFRRHRHGEPLMSNEVLLAQQKQLECDITLANDHIYQLNTKNEVRTIRLEKNLSVSSTKSHGKLNRRRKVVKSYVYDQLYDGVHANGDLSLQWFSVVRIWFLAGVSSTM